jgi:hypothetical protein
MCLSLTPMHVNYPTLINTFFEELKKIKEIVIIKDSLTQFVMLP